MPMKLKCNKTDSFFSIDFSDWNILTGEDVKTIANNAPTTIEDLKALGILGEKKLEEYGSRIVKPIKLFVEKEGLEDQLQRQRRNAGMSSGKNSSRNKTSEEVIEIADDDDEFETGIDYSAIDLQY